MNTSKEMYDEKIKENKKRNACSGYTTEAKKIHKVKQSAQTHNQDQFTRDTVHSVHIHNISYHLIPEIALAC